MQVTRKMKTSRILAAAAAVSLSLGASFARAGGLPYSTSFETTPDAQGQTYTTGNIQGQNGWVNETGEPAGEATVTNTTAANGSQSVQITSQSNGYADYYNSSLADHPAAGTNASPAGTPLNPATYGGIVDITFSLDHASPGNGETSNPLNRSGFGLDVLDQNDNIIASLFTKTSVSGQNDLVVTNGTSTPDTTVAGPAGAGLPDNTWGTYHMELNFNNDTFTVFVNGNAASATYAMNSLAGNQIGGIAFATDGSGTNTAFFDSLSVVPEPASVGMVSLGGLLMLAKRRRARLA